MPRGWVPLVDEEFACDSCGYDPVERAYAIKQRYEDRATESR